MKEPIKEISKKRYMRARGKNNKYLQEGTGAKRQVYLISGQKVNTLLEQW